MTATARVYGIVIECPDPASLAAFYSELTGWEVAGQDPDWYTLKHESAGVYLSFQQAPGHQPPTWPDPTSSMQYHLDLMVDDMAAAEAQAVKLGATRMEHQPSPESFVVYADPAGHPFCLCVQ